MAGARGGATFARAGAGISGNGASPCSMKVLCGDEHFGRPLGDGAFLASLKRNLCRIFRREKSGLKGKHPSCVWCFRNQT